MVLVRLHVDVVKMPVAVQFVDVVPRNASGKALKRELRTQFPGS